MIDNSNENIIVLKNLVKDYQLGNTIVHAIKGCSLAIKKGEFLSVSGPSGSGKTTLLNIMGCLDKPTTGDVYISGRNVANLKERGLAIIRRGKIGFIFQAFNLIPVLSAYENVEYALKLSKNNLSTEKETRIISVFKEVGLEGFMRHKPNELSGGQRQRVAIARALVKKPEIILADEPTANLDSKTGESIIDLMRKINKEDGVTFVFSTHDPMVKRHASRIVNIHDGTLVD